MLSDEIKAVLNCDYCQIHEAVPQTEVLEIQRNADIIKSCCSMFETEIWYWDADQDLDILPKSSPTDTGKTKFEEIIEEQLVRIY